MAMARVLKPTRIQVNYSLLSLTHSNVLFFLCQSFVQLETLKRRKNEKKYDKLKMLLLLLLLLAGLKKAKPSKMMYEFQHKET